MKKSFCILLVVSLVLICAALAENTPEVSETLEIIAVDIAPVASSTPEATTPPEVTVAPSDTVAPEASPSSSAAADAEMTPEPSFEAVPAGPVTLAFEDGFTLQLPEGWLYHEVSDEMAAQGVYYSLSDSTGVCRLYIQSWLSDCADMNALKELIDRTTAPQSSGVYAFNGTDFVVYDLSEGDISCCAALKDGRVLNFVFTPQSDPDYMLTAAQIMSSYTVLDF